MIRFVNAKINLGLLVTEKRPDNYHNIETVFYPVGKYNGTPVNPSPFCDILEITELSGPEDEFFFVGKEIDCVPESNLVVRAATLFKEELVAKGLNPSNYTIILEKHLPQGAGLGGGSADAAFTLALLNELNRWPLDKKSLARLALRLGADCPFFIENEPMYASGVGEILSPVDLDLSGHWAVIVKPRVHISTAEAFAGIKPCKPQKDIRDIVSQPIDLWDELGLKNDFEPHIFSLHPELGAIREALKKEGALYASMSGSGSAIYGIFREHEAASAAFDKMACEFSAFSDAFICLL